MLRFKIEEKNVVFDVGGVVVVVIAVVHIAYAYMNSHTYTWVHRFKNFITFIVNEFYDRYIKSLINHTE